MDYATIAHAIKIGGTVFFFGFFFLAMTYLFWPKNAKTLASAIAQIMLAFIITGALIAWAVKTGGFATIALGVILLLTYIGSLYYYRTTNDPRYEDVAYLPLGDESLIGPSDQEVVK